MQFDFEISLEYKRLLNDVRVAHDMVDLFGLAELRTPEGRAIDRLYSQSREEGLPLETILSRANYQDAEHLIISVLGCQPE